MTSFNFMFADEDDGLHGDKPNEPNLIVLAR